MTRVTPELFVEFARLKLAADASDAYITGAVALARASDDPWWYAGCFTTPYAPPTNEVLFTHWPRAEVLRRPVDLHAWVAAHWRGLPISGARHVNGMGPAKLADTLVRYARWIDADGPLRLDASSATVAFRQLLRDAHNHGRYTGMKLYETLRRVGVAIPPFDDLQPRGGRTPRKALAAIFTDVGHDYRSDRPPALVEANALADLVRRAVPTTWFDVEVLLCNFHQLLDGHFYVGYALDKELDRLAVVRRVFPDGGAATLAARATLYDPIYLGERHGWALRKELRRAWRDHRVLWSDARYDYRASRDISQPRSRCER